LLWSDYSFAHSTLYLSLIFWFIQVYLASRINFIAKMFITWSRLSDSLISFVSILLYGQVLLIVISALLLARSCFSLIRFWLNRLTSWSLTSLSLTAYSTSKSRIPVSSTNFIIRISIKLTSWVFWNFGRWVADGIHIVFNLSIVWDLGAFRVSCSFKFYIRLEFSERIFYVYLNLGIHSRSRSRIEIT
jgi:hypothetical protein